MTRKRLLIDAHCFDREHQGTRAFIKRLYGELSTLTDRYEFYFAARDHDNLVSELGHVKGAKFLRYRFSSTIWRLLFNIPYLVIRHRIYLAHFQYIVPAYCPCRRIVTTHDVLFKDFPEEFSLIYRLSRHILFGASIRRADLVTTVSEYSRKAITKHFGRNDILLVENGIDAGFLAPYDRAHSRAVIHEKYGFDKFILYVSRFEPRKNHSQLLAAWLELKLHEAGYHLVMLGHDSIPTPEFRKLLDSADEHTRRFIHISSAIGDEALSHFYKAAHVFVYPSRAEGFGLPPIEAGALRVPVLCSNATALAQFTFFGEYHIDLSDHSLFVARLARIVDSPPDCSELNRISDEIGRRFPFDEPARIFLGALDAL